MLEELYRIDFRRKTMFAYLSQILNVQLAMINNERMKTRRTVPGQIVINVFSTNVVLNLIRLNAPILLDDASRIHMSSSMTRSFDHTCE